MFEGLKQIFGEALKSAVQSVMVRFLKEEIQKDISEMKEKVAER